MLQNNSYDSQLSFAKSTALLAGDIMRKHFGTTITERKADGSPVTFADRLINDMVISESKAHFPTYAVLGEERSRTLTHADYTWVCDPIDGTLPYTLGIPTNVFALALVTQNGSPVVAVVYDPYLYHMYWATKDGGAYMNGMRLSVNETHELGVALIGMSGRSSHVVSSPALTQAVKESSDRIFSLYSVIYEAMLVASGKLDAAIYMGDGSHDGACAQLIVHEAGGIVTDLFGSEQRYDKPIRGALITNGRLHQQMLRHTIKHRIITPDFVK